MSQNNPFDHADPLQANIAVAVFRTIKRLDSNQLVLSHRDDPWHIDMAYDIRSHFDRDERKLCRNVEKCVPMIMAAVHQLEDCHFLEFKQADKGRVSVLTIGHAAPKQLPALRTVAKTRRTVRRRSERSTRQRLVPAYR